jgi:hypothetical protein
MESVVLKKNKAHLPFFNKRISVVGGLDPLGLQNSSVRTYSMLLPGLNNVTGKIRYYSFYCWLIHQYYNTNKSYSPKEQLRYIRFGEYVIALLAHIDNEQPMQGISGSLYANRQIENNEHRLIEATFNEDKTTTRGTYWTFKWGAFGQYYLGALRNLGLVDAHESTANLYDLPSFKSLENVITGELLANVFEKSIIQKGTTEKDVFLEKINNPDAEIDNATLKKIRPLFDLTKVATDAEREALTNLLLQADYPHNIDYPTYYRKSTITELLAFLRDTDIEKPQSRNFTFYAYERKGQTALEDNSCMMGWFYYQFNEFWQFANTSILNGFLDHLVITHGNQSVPFSNYLDELTKATIEELERLFKQENLTDRNAHGIIIDNSVTMTVAELYHALNKTQGIERVVLSFILIWKLFEENHEHLENLTSFFKLKNLGTYNRFSSLGYLSYLREIAKQQTLYQYIHQFLHKHIIYRHQLVALKKMPSTLSKTTQKFQLEENEIRYLRNYNPTFTGPRIGNLMSFLNDLEVIDTNKKLTKLGEKLLIELLPNKNN